MPYKENDVFKKAVFVFGLLTLASIPNAHALPGLEVSLGIGSTTRTPSGTLQYQGGTNADLKNTLNLSDHTDMVGQLKIKHAIPVIPNFYIGYLPMSFSGDKTGTTAVTYGGQTFTAGTKLQTELKMDALDIGLFYDIPFIKTATAGILDPEIGVNIRSLSFSGKLTGTANGVANTTVEKSATIPVPMLYVGLGIYPIKFLSFNAQMKTLSVGGNGVTEWNAEMAIHPMPVLFVALGYNSQSMTLDTDNLKTDLRFSGPYLAVGAAF